MDVAIAGSQAEISFRRIDGTLFFGRPMTGRWADSPEPRLAHVQTPTGTVPALTNPEELKATVDIYPGDVEILDVAVKVDKEQEAYGWNNESFFHLNWRNQQRQLNHERYLVEVTVTSSGRKSRASFRIDNDGPFAAFRLAALTPAQRQAVSN